MASVFLSHNRFDKPFVRELARDLRNAGVKVWLDEAEIRIGDSIVDKVGKGIDEADFVAVILSPDSVGSPWVQRELQIATHQEIAGKRIKVLPILYKTCKIPPFLVDKIYADFRDSSEYYNSLAQLAETLSGNTEKIRSGKVKLRRIAFSSLFVLRDVLLINILTGLNGFILGLIGVRMTETISGVGQFIFMLVGFIIAGLLTPYRRWQHLIIVGIFVWAVNFLGILTVPEINIFVWLINFFPIMITMALGGLISQLLYRAFYLTRERLRAS